MKVEAHFFQSDRNVQKAVIGFPGRTLKGSKLTYFTTEKELLAIVPSLSQLGALD